MADARTGLLDQRVTFQRQARSADTQGGAALTWSAIAGLSNVAAAVEADGGGEGRDADQSTAVLRWRVVVRYSATAAGVTAKDRLTWSGRTLEIDAVRPTGHRFREWIELAAVERHT